MGKYNTDLPRRLGKFPHCRPELPIGNLRDRRLLKFQNRITYTSLGRIYNAARAPSTNTVWEG